MTSPSETSCRRESQYRLLFEQNSAPMCIYEVGSLALVAVNEAFERLYGYSGTEAVTVHFSDLFIETAWEDFANQENGLPAAPRFPGWCHRHKNGSLLHVMTEELQDIIHSGKACKLVAITDISELKTNELELRLTKESLNRINRLAKIGSWYFDVTTGEGSWCENTVQIHDLEPNTVFSVQLGLSFFHGPARETLEQALEKVLEQEKPYDLELEMTSAQGVHKWVRVMGGPVVEQGRVVKVEGAIQDITDRKLAQQKADQREIILGSLLSLTPDLFFLMGADSTILDYQAQRKEDLYVPPEAFLGKRMTDILPAEVGASFQEKMNKILEKGELECFEYTLDLPNGKHKYFEARIINFPDRGIAALVRDITKFKRLEEHLHIIADNTYNWESWRNSDGKLVWSSPSCKNICGYSAEELTGKEKIDFQNLVHPDDQGIWAEHIKSVTEFPQQSEHENLVLKVIKKTGEIVWVSHTCRPIYNKEGVFQGRRSCDRDISENLQLIQRLKASETHFRHLIEKAPFPILISSVQGKVVQYCNERAEKLFMVRSDQIIGQEVKRFYRFPAERDHIYECVSKEGGVFDREICMYDGEGNIFWALLSATPVGYDGKQAIMFAYNDITATKESEWALKYERNQLHNRIKEQKCLYKITTATADVNAHPDAVMQQVVNLVPSGFQFSEIASARIDWGGKQYCTQGFIETPWQQHGTEQYSGQGEPVRLTVAYSEAPPIVDAFFSGEERTLAESIVQCLVSFVDRMQAAETIKEHETLINTMFNQSQEAIALVDPLTTGFVNFNKIACQGLGYTRDELFDLSLKTIHADDFVEQFVLDFSKTLTGQSVEMETRHICKDGALRDIAMTFRPITHKSQSLICAVWRDITEQKKRERLQQCQTARIRLQNQLISTLSTAESGINGEVDLFSHELTELLGDTLGADRVSVWMREEDESCLVCLDLYETTIKRHSSRVHRLEQDMVPAVFKTFSESRYIDASNALTDPRTAGCRELYLKPFGIQSVLGCSILSGGKNWGAICFEYVQRHHTWEYEEIMFGCQLADQIGMVILNKNRLEMARALQQSEGFLKRAQAVSKTGHWYLDIRRNRYSLSDEACRLFDVPSGSQLSRDAFSKLIHQDDLVQMQQVWEKALKGTPYEITHRIIVKEQTRWVVERAEIESDHAGQPLFVMGICQDITEQVKTSHVLEQYRDKLEELVASRTIELERAKIEAESANKAKSVFLSNMSHEIRTPLNAVVGYAYLLKNGSLTSQQQANLDKLSGSAQHLMGIINDVLDFSKIEAGQTKLDITDFELARVFENVLSTVSEKIEAKKLSMMVDTEHLPLMLRGDFLRFTQILLNLVSNAVKFTEKGYVNIVGSVLAQESNRVTLRIEVQDSGVGIPDDQKSLIFGRFEQGSAGSHFFGGTGLGLAISRSLVHMMSGRIGVESAFGRGSVFWVEIPFEIPVNKPESIENLDLFKGLRVLIIEDDIRVGEIIRKMLLSLGVRADRVESGKEGLLATVKADQVGDAYELVIVDWKMPHMDGIETIKRIQALSLEKQLHYLLVTGYNTEISREDWGQACPTFILSKPVMLPDLKKTMLKVLTRAPDKQNFIKKDTFETELAKRQGAHILLVEDNSINQDLVGQLMQSIGMRVSFAPNGQRAVDMVRSTSYDLILMDIQMPVMDGLQATKVIRRLPDRENLPILALTANAFSEDRLKSIQAGMNGHVGKPLEPEKLFANLIKWIPPRTDIADMTPWPIVGADDRSAEEEILVALQAVPGLDTDVGLRYLRNNVPQYIRLLRTFVEQHGDDATLLSQQAAADDFEAVRHTAHTLKGVAGTLGVISIQAPAFELEKVAKQATDTNQLHHNLDMLVEELKKIAPALRQALPPQQENIASVAIEVADLSQVNGVLKRLEAKLANDDTSANDLFEESKPLLVEIFGDAVNKLDHLIQDYEYADALEIVRAAGKTRKLPKEEGRLDCGD